MIALRNKNMNVKDTAKMQYVQIVNRTAEQISSVKTPGEGWLAMFRKALGMSGADVAARSGVSRNAIYQAERNERNGVITLNQMHKLAEAMGGHLVYAIVPKEGRVDEIIQAQAHRKAQARIMRASEHMALEQQSLTSEQTKIRVNNLTDELMRNMPPDFWSIK
jgi:predicted DNA-binding mobile mystery protein A